MKEKTAAKDKATSDRLANQVISKCNPVSLSFASTLADAASALLPVPVATDAKQKLEAIQELVKRAKLIVDDELDKSELGVTKVQALLIT